MRYHHSFLVGVLCIGVIVFALLFILFVPRQYAIGTSSYPANIDFEGISNYGNYNPDALANPNVGAVDISMNWAQVEPQQGVFNWAPADKVMADWSAQGKKFTIVVRYINEGGSCSSSQFTPAWELARVPNFCDSDYGDVVPDYFNPTFKADLKAYVQAIGQHIANSPYRNNLLYIRIGVGIGGEGFPLPRKGDYLTVDKPQLESWGYTPTVWVAWQEEMLTSYKSSLPFTTIIYPLNALDTDPATGQPVQVEVAKWAAAQGMGVGQQGLEPGTNYPLFQQLRGQYPQIYFQYQTVYSLNGNVTSSCNISCVAQADIQAAETNGAQFIEWYSQDIINSSLQSYFAQWQQYVNSKYGGPKSQDSFWSKIRQNTPIRENSSYLLV